MTTFNKKEHWEHIYNTKALTDVSWYQETPKTSLQLIEDLKLPKTAKIIDIGGGDSLLVDHLLALGYKNISVLDISKSAIDKAKLRLGALASKVTWIIADAANFEPQTHYDLWHDRAAFHFLNSEEDITNYVSIANTHITHKGHLIIGTFSKNGPEKCSGIPITQYDEAALENTFKSFQKNKAITTLHQTPFNTSQEFVFCVFKQVAHENN